MVVDVYIDSETLGAFVAEMRQLLSITESLRKLFLEEQAPWGVKDFTYDEAGTTITGLSDSGKVKDSEEPVINSSKRRTRRKSNYGIRSRANNKLRYFVVSADDKNYTPASVMLPDIKDNRKLCICIEWNCDI